MAIEFEVVFNNFSAIADRLADEAAQVVGETAFELQREIQESFRGPKAGRAYSRGGVIHVASAPGEPPAIDTGTYLNSWQTDYQPGSFEAVVGTASDYGPYLEYGTRHMAPRPHVRPAVERQQAAMVERLARIEGRLGR